MTNAPEHAELNDLVNAYLDGELDAAERARLETHLSACAACRLELEQLRATRGALRALPPLRAPRPFTIAAPAREAHPPAGLAAGWLRPLAWTWRLGSVAAAACLIMAWIAAGPVAPSGNASVAARPAASGPAEADPRLSLADRDASQRVAPQRAAGSGAPSAAPGQGMAAPAAPGQDLAGAQRAPQPSAGPPQAPAKIGQEQAGGADAGNLAPPAAAGAAAGEAPAQPVPAEPSGQDGSTRAWPPSGGLWLALAAIAALASAAAFAVERRARRAAPAPTR
jgi:hypothetical protein